MPPRRWCRRHRDTLPPRAAGLRRRIELAAPDVLERAPRDRSVDLVVTDVGLLGTWWLPATPSR
jgi:hypothetical protein